MLPFLSPKTISTVLIFVLIFSNIAPTVALAQEIDNNSSASENIPQLHLPFDNSQGSFSISLDFGEKYPAELAQKLGDIGEKEHQGVDFTMAEGTPILAADEGEVIKAGEGDFGKEVVIKHSWGESLYGHLSGVSVEIHQTITKGSLVGLSGNTGNSTGPHLHFGIKQKQDWINPSPYLDLTGIPKADERPDSLPPTLDATAAASLQKFLHPESTNSAVLGADQEATESAQVPRLEDVSRDNDFLYNYKFELDNGVSAHFYDKRTKSASFAIADKDYSYKLRFFLKQSSPVIANPEGVKQSSPDVEIASSSATPRNDVVGDSKPTVDGNEPSQVLSVDTLSKESKPVVDQNKIEFPIVVSGIPMTLRYTVESGRVKEEFLLNEKPTQEQLNNLSDKLEIPFELQARSLEAEKSGSGYIFKSQNGSIEWEIAEPTVIDANGKSGEIILEIPDKNSSILKVDKSYLEQASYPVVIDPTVIVGLSSSNSATQASTQRNIVNVTDGATSSSGNLVLHSFVQLGTNTTTCGSGGLWWAQSNDSGATWSCAKRISSDTTNLMFASASTDENNNVYVTYAVDTNGVSASFDLYYFKLTHGSGTTWTTVATDGAQKIQDGGASDGYSYATIEYESTNSRLWVATRYFNNTNYQTNVYYSDGIGDTPTWATSISAADTAGTGSNRHYSTLVRFGSNKLGVIFADEGTTNVKWKYRTDTDTVTSWTNTASVENSITASAPIFKAVGDSNGNVYYAQVNGTSLFFRYYNGNVWSGVTTVTSSTVNATFVSLTTDGTNVWVMYTDSGTPVSLASGFATNVRNLVYKKGIWPFDAGHFDTTATAVVDYHGIYDKVWLFDGAGSTFEDLTTAAGNTTTADVKHSVTGKMLKSVNGVGTTDDDAAYFGKISTQQFDNLSYSVSTAGAGGAITWEYCSAVDGSTACTTWSSLTISGSNTNFNSTSGGTVGFTPPAGWVTAKVNSESTAYYYIRARVSTSYTSGSEPIGTQMVTIPPINWGSLVKSPISNTVYGIWTEASGAITKSRNSSFSVTTTTSTTTADISPSVVGYSSLTTATQVSQMRNIVRTSDGTLHAFVQGGTQLTCGGTSSANNNTGLVWLYLSSGGTTWNCGGSLISDTTNAFYASAKVDSSDNIYVTYTMIGAAVQGSGSGDLYFRKLTYSAGSWTLGSQIQVVDAASTEAFTYGTIETDSQSRIWIATRYFKNTGTGHLCSGSANTYCIIVYNTTTLSPSSGSDFSAAITNLDTTAASNAHEIGQIVAFGGNKIGVVYQSTDSNPRLRYRNDADAVGTWQSAITDSSGIGNTIFSVAGDSGGHVYYASNSSTSVFFNYFNGASWGASVNTVSSTASSNLFVSVGTDGSNAYVFYPETSGLNSSLNGNRKLVYKIGTNSSETFSFGSATAVVSYHDVFDKVWSATSGGTSFSDQTSSSQSSSSTNTQMVTASSDALYFGKSTQYDAISYGLQTNGDSTGRVIWEYCSAVDGSTACTTWSELTNILARSNTNFEGGGYISFTPPSGSNWVAAKVNSESTAYYYIRARVTTAYPTTSPVGTQFVAIPQINWGTVTQTATSKTFYPMYTGGTTNPSRVRQTSITYQNTPNTPSSLGPSGLTSGGWYNSTNQPTFQFTLSDPDPADTVKYQIQISLNSDYSSPVVDYTSALQAQGATSFTVGQSAGSGTYTTGSSGQTLAQSSSGYYWRVLAIDNAGASSSYATGGSPAFKLDTVAPASPGTPTTGGSYTTNSKPTWSWTASSDATSGLANPAYTLAWSTDSNFNTGGGSSTTNGTSFTHSIALADGTWYFRVTVTDQAGNTSVGTGSVTVDTVSPAAFALIAPPDNVFTTQDRPIFK